MPTNQPHTMRALRMHVYYPEMGEKPDESRLFQHANHVGQFTFVEWSPQRDAEARAALKRLRIRPVIDRVELAGGHKFVARLTAVAWQRVRAEGDVSVETLL